MRPYLDKVAPDAWKAASTYSLELGKSVAALGLTFAEAELIKVRVSQMNACAFCLNLHSGEARTAGVPQQKLDLLPAWREAALFNDREQAVLAIAEAATVLPISEDAQADLAGARSVLGDEAFVAAEWVAASINMFNRISILSEHPVEPRE